VKKERFTVALAGNPNSGKSTIFNAITGAHQHVGNYPGVTVEKTQGKTAHRGVGLDVVDLPGTYSLTAYSTEEIVARNFIMDGGVDVVVDIIDSSNLERNLYLATQLIELGVPLVLAFNMFDVAQKRGFRIDVRKLSGLLGVPIVPTVGPKGDGIDELLDAVIEVARAPAAAVAGQRRPNYGSELQPHVRQLARLVDERCDIARHRQWFTLKLLEGDAETIKRLRKLCPDHVEELLTEAGRLRGHIEGICGDAPEIILADRRYGFISGACTEAVRRTVEARHELSDRIDAVVTNRYLGLPLFAILMYLVFQMTFAIGGPAVELLDEKTAGLGEWISGLLPGAGLLESLLVDGIIGGLGAVIVFVPLIMLLFLAIAFLEDSGYMARAAFVVDKLMHRIGLHGKSFIPMLIGFGCTVPGIMATRTLETRRDRLTTMLVLPLMSCGARLPVYVLILGAFFPTRVLFRSMGVFEVTNQALLLFAIYLIGIVLAIICARILRKTIFRGDATPFVMELPPYRMPTLRGLGIHTWERTWLYVKKAGTIILTIVILLWAMATWPRLSEAKSRRFEAQQAAVAASELSEEAKDNLRAKIDDAEHQAELENSAIGKIGKAIAPALRPCGFDWKISTALLGSLAAKEVFVGQMGVIYAVGKDAGGASASLREKLAATYTPLQGLCIMLFILVSSPCVATVAVTMRESGSWKWALLQWGYLTALAWVLTTVVYHGGKLLGL